MVRKSEEEEIDFLVCVCPLMKRKEERERGRFSSSKSGEKAEKRNEKGQRGSWRRCLVGFLSRLQDTIRLGWQLRQHLHCLAGNCQVASLFLSLSLGFEVPRCLAVGIDVRLDVRARYEREDVLTRRR